MAKLRFIQHVSYLDKNYVFQGTLNLTDHSFCCCVLGLSVILTFLFLASWETDDLLSLLYVICHFPIWCPGSDMLFDLSIPDLCVLPFALGFLHL